MYVCICNAVTEDDVHGCMATGCATVKDVRTACGMQPGCGSCTRRISTLISRYRTASELADALTGGPLPLSTVPRPAGPMHVTAEGAAPEHFASEPLAERPETSEPMMPEHAGRGTAPPSAA